MKYFECIKDFNVDYYNDDGRYEEHQISIKQGSVWYVDEEADFRIINGEIRLIEDKEGHYNWLEITQETLNGYFKEYSCL